MRVSQRLDYAVRALTALAQRPPGRPVAAGELADRLGLPKRFLEQQITTLAKHGLVECRRGSSGGCVLARPAGRITVADVVRAMQGDILDVPHVSGSAVSEMWMDTAEALETALSAFTLKDLADRQTEIEGRSAAMYYI